MSTKVYDLNRMRKSYPLRRRRPRYATLDQAYIENAIITISNVNQLPFTYIFQNSYSQAPVCIVTVENKSSNAYIESINTTSVVINSSVYLQSGETLKLHLQIFADQS